MTQRIEAFLELLETKHSADDLPGLTQAMQDVFEVENVAYLATNLNGLPFAAVTYSPEWAQTYEEQNYVAIDPVVRGALQGFQPMDWKRLDWSNSRSREFYHEAIGFGVGNQGYTVPIRGPNGQMALFAINQSSSDDKWQGFLNETANDLLLVSHYFHQQVLLTHDIDNHLDTKELSPREKDALKYLGVGLSRGKIAEKLQISEHTLRVYVDSARYKLGALNTTHAVALALARGVISV